MFGDSTDMVCLLPQSKKKLEKYSSISRMMYVTGSDECAPNRKPYRKTIQNVTSSDEAHTFTEKLLDSLMDWDAVEIFAKENHAQSAWHKTSDEAAFGHADVGGSGDDHMIEYSDIDERQGALE
jgi:hypothetical protein